ncbi:MULTISPECIES: hypothetical protein [Rhizobium]|nr:MULTISPECIES: hypothetical protein [Rhizobium]MCA0805395.1 hypothetical protein [Rhizobium sp. T1473]MCS0461831.1 hypothetical protein [Rhizobium favelukesii]UFS79274.1 hypothetical protein LPB79_06645 [Rhizobium sp. T136]
MEMTEGRRLAEEYLRLGGKRRVKIDDNQQTVRAWEADPPAAEQFWHDRVEGLEARRRKEVEFFLPSINSP